MPNMDTKILYLYL